MFFLKSRTSFARAGAAALVTAAASVAFAGLGGTGASATPRVPADNGDVKIHKTTTPDDDQRDEPQVCEFYLVGFNFDGGQQVAWRILAWPPTGKGEEALKGDLTLGQDGHGRTDDLKLADGHYRLVWNFDGENGKAKHKNFWVKCKTSTPTPTPTETSSKTPTPTPSDDPSETPAPTPTPVPTDLPVTG